MEPIGIAELVDIMEPAKVPLREPIEFQVPRKLKIPTLLEPTPPPEGPRIPGLIIPPPEEEEEEEEEAGRGAIAGVAINQATDQPIQGVDVLLDGRRTETDEQGRFTFRNLRPGMYKARALGEERTVRVRADRTTQIRFVVAAAGFLGELTEDLRSERPRGFARTISRRRRPERRPAPTIEGFV